jgi:hypothetical protein
VVGSSNYSNELSSAIKGGKYLKLKFYYAYLFNEISLINQFH